MMKDLGHLRWLIEFKNLHFEINKIKTEKLNTYLTSNNNFLIGKS